MKHSLCDWHRATNIGFQKPQGCYYQKYTNNSVKRQQGYWLPTL